ncbi:EF-hand domain-containing protein [Nocardia sp. NPDC046763]|uniref:EF-hand domain-containing protein n=1 Tax=Nocardia sp. NPDC046763 TaxID=3155256 RepID=UPI0033FEBA3F
MVMDQEQFEAAKQEFDQIDTDHDGYITLEEAVEWGATQGPDVGRAISRHMNQDRSGDGQVSFEEFLRYKMRDYDW